MRASGEWWDFELRGRLARLRAPIRTDSARASTLAYHELRRAFSEKRGHGIFFPYQTPRIFP
jgi:hypothetical protein